MFYSEELMLRLEYWILSFEYFMAFVELIFEYNLLEARALYVGWNITLGKIIMSALLVEVLLKMP